MSEPRGDAAVLFPGQGSQSLGMGLDLAKEERAAREMYELAEETLGLPLREIIGGTDAAALDRTDVCQPAILTTSLAAMAALEQRDLLLPGHVAAVAGLSLGEYSALAWAGALSPSSALRLVRLRGQAMQRASDERPSGMLSLVGATDEAAAALCEQAAGDGILVVANLLAPGQVAIAGTLDALERARGHLADHGIRKAVPLPVAGAFHSPCMESAAAALSEALANTEIVRPRVPVVMNVSGAFTDDPATIRTLLEQQITTSCLWRASMQTLFDAGCQHFLEPAPGRQLTNMLRRYDVESKAAVCNTAADLLGFEPWPPNGGHS
ncbi:MAG: ACP S-malonyltransferase [Planctomycetota bacterium]|jgi:[acyl-carrier-protein] S-malonyltransferase